jgi:hypothetical protein
VTGDTSVDGRTRREEDATAAVDGVPKLLLASERPLRARFLVRQSRMRPLYCQSDALTSAALGGSASPIPGNTLGSTPRE